MISGFSLELMIPFKVVPDYSKGRPLKGAKDGFLQMQFRRT
jgi:hypothetical protein